jgi:hypothetical protein
MQVASFFNADITEYLSDIARRMTMRIPSKENLTHNAVKAARISEGPEHEALCHLPRDLQMSILQMIQSDVWSDLAARLLVSPPEWQEVACSMELQSPILRTDGATLSLLNPDTVKRAFAGITMLYVEDLFHDAAGVVLGASDDCELLSVADMSKFRNIENHAINGHIWEFDSLKSLHLAGILHGDCIVKLMPGLSGLKALEITESLQAASVAAPLAASFSNLHSLTALTHNGPQVESATMCCGISELRALQSLHLNCNLRRHVWCGSSALRASAPHLLHLASVTLEGWRIPTEREAGNLGAALAALPALTMLHLHDCACVTEALLSFFDTLADATGLRELRLNRMDDFMGMARRYPEVSDALASLSCLQRVEALIEMGSPNDAEPWYNDIMLLGSNLSNLTALTGLDCLGYDVAALPVLTSLRQLRIGNTSERPNASQMGAITGLPLLQVLEVDHLDWAAQAAHLVSACPSSLTALQLGRIHDGASYSEDGSLPDSDCPLFGRSQISVQLAADLAGALRNLSALQKLTLEDADLADTFVAILALHLALHPTLKRLQLSGGYITPAGVNTLRALLPETMEIENV